MEDITKSGIRTKVLMLSATTVNNRLLNLRNQIEIIAEGDDEYLSDDGIPSINSVTRRAQQRFQEWSKLDDEERTTQSFVNAVSSDYFKCWTCLPSRAAASASTSIALPGTRSSPRGESPSRSIRPSAPRVSSPPSRS